MPQTKEASSTFEKLGCCDTMRRAGFEERIERSRFRALLAHMGLARQDALLPS